VLGLYTQWRLFPFHAEQSFGAFLSQAGQLTTVTWLMIGLGALFAFWLGLGRESGPRLWRTPRE
jgi:hypothetical protein